MTEEWSDALKFGIIVGGIPVFITSFAASVAGLPVLWHVVVVVAAPFVTGGLIRIVGDYLTFGRVW